MINVNVTLLDTVDVSATITSGINANVIAMKGDKGEQGEQGEQGEDGDAGSGSKSFNTVAGVAGTMTYNFPDATGKTIKFLLIGGTYHDQHTQSGTQATITDNNFNTGGDYPITTGMKITAFFE